ncbi:MAG: hypothetical protein ABIA93_00885 [Candidatus Woesearchaeota archaeon]
MDAHSIAVICILIAGGIMLYYYSRRETKLLNEIESYISKKHPKLVRELFFDIPALHDSAIKTRFDVLLRRNDKKYLPHDEYLDPRYKEIRPLRTKIAIISSIMFVLVILQRILLGG